MIANRKMLAGDAFFPASILIKKLPSTFFNIDQVSDLGEKVGMDIG